MLAELQAALERERAFRAPLRPEHIAARDRGPNALKTCELCQGRGWTDRTEKVPHGHAAVGPLDVRFRDVCPWCGGRGRVLTTIGLDVLAILVCALGDERQPEATATAIAEFNAAADVKLSEASAAAAEHRRRLDEAAAVEKAGRQAADALRRGEAPPEESAGVLSRIFGGGRRKAS